MGSVKIVKASAGSGKTFNLAYEYVRDVISDPMQYRHTLAVTFTNKATEEMKQRIISEIHLLAEGHKTQYITMLERDLGLDVQTIREHAVVARTKILHDYSHFAVLTIDKFFQRIIRSFIKELGIDLKFNLELQTDSLLERSADELIDTISSDTELREWIFDFVEEKIDDNKRWDIKDELTALGREIFSEEYRTAGITSQTRTQLKEIVAQSTAKASAIIQTMRGEAKLALKIITDHNLSVDDFPFGKASFATYFYKIADGVVTEYGPRVRGALESDTRWYAAKSPRKEEILNVIPQLRPILERLCSDYDHNARFLSSVSLLRRNFRNFALLNDLAIRMQEICIRDNIMPMPETNYILRRLISDNDTPFIFEKVGNYYSRFMIDEFQDTSTMQWENFVPLLENATSQSAQTPVLLVGDIKQSIYRWRGGDWQILAKRVGEHFADVHESLLDTNYRSSRNVVEFNNNIIAGCVAIGNDALNAKLNDGRERGDITAEFAANYRDLLHNAYHGHQQKSKPSADEGYVNITVYGDGDLRSVPPVIDRIEDLQRRGYKPDDIAILVRTNAEGVRIANMLLDHKSRNPDSPYCFDVVTQEALSIGASDIVRFIVSTMTLAINADDQIKRAQYNHQLGRGFADPIPSDEQAFLHSVRLLPPQEAFELIVAHYDLGRDGRNTAYLQALHEQVITFGTNTVCDIALFLRWWNDSGAKQSINTPPNNNAITIISVHKAKGLEYKAVLIPYCNWELHPKFSTVLWANGEETPFEGLKRIPLKYTDEVGRSHFSPVYYKELVLCYIDNINILYVAATRAVGELHLMIPKSSSQRLVSSLIISAFELGDTSATLGSMSGRVTHTDQGQMVEFGTPPTVVSYSQSPSRDVFQVPFLSTEIGSRVKLRLPSQRYVEDGAPQTLSPRNYGILMHKAFERAVGAKDIESSVTLLQRNGTISAGEAQLLRDTMTTAFADERIRSWFDGSWDTVRTENEIIIPGGELRRPDRVMIRDNRATIVDYKFGLERSARHHRQLESYRELLLSMGYSSVEAYIWYVSLNDVEQV